MRDGIRDSSRGQRQCSRRRVAAGLRPERGCDHGFRQRHRQRVIACAADQLAARRRRQSDTAVRFRRPGRAASPACSTASQIAAGHSPRSASAIRSLVTSPRNRRSACSSTMPKVLGSRCVCVRSSCHRNPRPRAMMPRRISRVPPRKREGRRVQHDVYASVSDNASSGSSRLASTGQQAARNFRQVALERGADVLHQRRFGIRALPSSSRPATDVDMRCSAARCATKRPISTACRRSGFAPTRSINSTSSR